MKAWTRAYLRGNISQESLEWISGFFNADIYIKYLGHGNMRFASLVINPKYGKCVKKVLGYPVFVSKNNRFFTHLSKVSKEQREDFERIAEEEHSVWQKVNKVLETERNLQFVKFFGEFEGCYYFEYSKPNKSDRRIFELMKKKSATKEDRVNRPNKVTEMYMKIFRKEWKMCDFTRLNFIGEKFVDFMIKS